jgi:replication factor C subunit 2/4
MDKFHNSTRFVFTCNTSSKIIESIQSRCKIIRYIRLSNDKVSNRLETILKLEKVKYQKKALDEVGLLSGGDMRLAINLLQLVSDRFKNVTIDNIEILCETPPHNVIHDILELIKKDIKKALKRTFELKESGYSINDIFIGFFNYFKSPNNMSDDSYKMNIILIISEYMYNVLKYSDTDINLTSFILDISQIK